MNEAATEPKHKRRWYQYSLRSMLLIMILFCFLFAWVGVKIRQAQKQKEVVALLEQEGVSVYYDYFEWGKYNPQPPGPKWVHEWLGIDFFNDVSTVSLSRDDLVDLSPLKDLTSLQCLTFWGGHLTREEVQNLQSGLPNCNIRWSPDRNSNLQYWCKECNEWDYKHEDPHTTPE